MRSSCVCVCVYGIQCVCMCNYKGNGSCWLDLKGGGEYHFDSDHCVLLSLLLCSNYGVCLLIQLQPFT